MLLVLDSALKTKTGCAFVYTVWMKPTFVCYKDPIIHSLREKGFFFSLIMFNFTVGRVKSDSIHKLILTDVVWNLILHIELIIT